MLRTLHRHLAAEFIAPMQADALITKAADLGIGLQSWKRHASGKSTRIGLAFGYGMIRADQIDQAVRRFAQAMS